MNINIVELAVHVILSVIETSDIFTLKLSQISHSIIYTHHHFKNKILLHPLIVSGASASPERDSC